MKMPSIHSYVVLYNCVLTLFILTQFNYYMIKLYWHLRSSEVIPETGIKSKNIPGWNDYIKHLKLTASLWRNLWRDNSSPLTGQIHDIMKETRRKYHYGIRNVKSNEEDIKKQKFAETLV